MGSNIIKKRLVKEEWVLNPRCRICGVVTNLPKKSDFGRSSNTTATYGHLYSKTDIRRALDDRAWQLECYKCNYDKQQEENPIHQYISKYGNFKNVFCHRSSYPELLIALAETKENEIYLTQIELKK